MNQCPKCRSDYAAFTATSGILRSLSGIDVSPGFEDRVLARVRAASVSPAPVESGPIEISMEPRWWEGWFPKLALAGSVAALAIVVSLNRPESPKVAEVESVPAPAGQLASSGQDVMTLQELYPDLSPEVMQSMQNLTRDGVLDRMVIQQGSPSGDIRVVTPVGYGADGPVYVTF
ncbi:MAG TPA: anti-sigma factor [Thermoanaerobaculia bacterium]|nr:anti-sigma factor [Thermoanaerobaculia bacterium]